jgi:proteasome beta subunit
MHSGFELRKGTTTIGIKTPQGVVLAADKRATAGYMVANKHVAKIVRISVYCAATIAGTVGEAFNLVETLRAETEIYRVRHDSKLKVSGIANLASSLLQSRKFYALPVQLIIGGFDEQPNLFMIDFFGSLSKEDYVATGSGSQAALGTAQDKMNQNLTLDQAAEVAARSISSAISWDSATGEGIDLVIVDSNGVKFLSNDEITRLLDRREVNA